MNWSTWDRSAYLLSPLVSTYSSGKEAIDVKCVFCGYGSAIKDEFFHMPWSEKIHACWNCCADISTAVRTRIVNGDTDVIERIIKGLHAKIESIKQKLQSPQEDGSPPS